MFALTETQNAAATISWGQNNNLADWIFEPNQAYHNWRLRNLGYFRMHLLRYFTMSNSFSLILPQCNLLGFQCNACGAVRCDSFKGFWPSIRAPRPFAHVVHCVQNAGWSVFIYINALSRTRLLLWHNVYPEGWSPSNDWGALKCTKRCKLRHKE